MIKNIITIESTLEYNQELNKINLKRNLLGLRPVKNIEEHLREIQKPYITAEYYYDEDDRRYKDNIEYSIAYIYDPDYYNYKDDIGYSAHTLYNPNEYRKIEELAWRPYKGFRTRLVNNNIKICIIVKDWLLHKWLLNHSDNELPYDKDEIDCICLSDENGTELDISVNDIINERRIVNEKFILAQLAKEKGGKQ